MSPRRASLLLALVFGLAACQPASPPADAPRPASGAADGLRTEAFDPEPIRVVLDSLPQPYATESAGNSSEVVDVPAAATLYAPPGFEVTLWADDLEESRWLALTPEGDVLVTETRVPRIRRLRDTDGDGVADTALVFADDSNGLNLPLGMAFVDGAFYLANTDAVVRYPYAPGQGRLEGTGTRITDLPGRGYNQHWTRNLAVAPDSAHLFISVGSETNVDVEPLPRASILRMRLDGSERTVYASGLRNPVGLAIHPTTGALYTTVNERDGLGDDLVPDYLTRVQEGGFYGWPFAYLAPGNLDPRHVANGRSARPDLAAQTITPDVLFQAHSAALGLTFIRGTQFPERYRQGAFVAMHGSWNRDQGTGYKLVFVPFDAQGQPLGYYEDFVYGFMTEPSGPTVFGRPTGVLALPDGSLLFSNDANGRIYRVAYVGA